MPRIFDNIESDLLPAMSEAMGLSTHADFCVGYFNLRGWRRVDEYVEQWSGGDDNCCRLLVGMQAPPQEELRQAFNNTNNSTGELDHNTAHRLKSRLAEDFRQQLTLGSPTNEDEAGLRRLAKQIKSRKVVVKLFLKHSLHAKLYLLFRNDPVNPYIGFLGSSNLTFRGLSSQGELNIDVLDHDACEKLVRWFEDRWCDRLCVDISNELAEIIDKSWAREDPIPPFQIYIKIAYHLSEDARSGLTEFQIPKDFGNKLLEFQTAAVKIAAQYLNKRGGVIIGDVVGLGKTLMATALARIIEDDLGYETLIICPKNLVSMWDSYQYQYRLRAKVLSISRVQRELPNLRRYRLLIIDESHNLRNRAGRRYKVIQDYINTNDCKCILLSATPYNKTYQDLSSQIRLFVSEDEDLGIRPERYLREIGETEFSKRHQASPRSIAAFEYSKYPDDWRDLMRLFLVRRTRKFVKENYGEIDPETERTYLNFEDGTKSYFPARVPKTVKFESNEQYSLMFANDVLDVINELKLPRYGLGNYVISDSQEQAKAMDRKVLDDLSRAGRRLMGFCRTNLFKRLESSGYAFLLSLRRHVLRNCVYLHALEKNKKLPIGTSDLGIFDPSSTDEDAEILFGDLFDEFNDENEGESETPELDSYADAYKQGAKIYTLYTNKFSGRFRWVGAHHFDATLKSDLIEDTKNLLNLLVKFGDWDAQNDSKLDALHHVINEKHPDEKVLVFSQFADTVDFLNNELTSRGMKRIAAVTGTSVNPTDLAYRFSPRSNESETNLQDELRVLISTDILSEGQNLQDCAIVINYDLPWAIIRLIQRAGRVDRIGQKATNILCYSFLPTDGIEQVIRLRERVHRRLHENAEVVGTDESFFEDDKQLSVLDLYNEKEGILDQDDDTEVDLSSYAYQIWKNAINKDSTLEKKIEDLPHVVYSSKYLAKHPKNSSGVLVYLRTSQGFDALSWVNRMGESVTESQFEILRAAQCSPDTPALPRLDEHHSLVQNAASRISSEQSSVGGQLGRPSGARFKVYERLKYYVDSIDSDPLRHAIQDIYNYPLKQSAITILNRQLRIGISDEQLAKLVIALRDEDRLSIVLAENNTQESQIICSLGLISEEIV